MLYEGSKQGPVYHRLLDGGKAAGRPFAATVDLSLAGFFFPLFKPVLGMGGHPAIRQQGLQGKGAKGLTLHVRGSNSGAFNLYAPTGSK